MAPDKTSDVLVTGSKWRSGIGLDICCPNRAAGTHRAWRLLHRRVLAADLRRHDQRWKDEASIPGNSLRSCSPWSNLKQWCGPRGS